MKLYNSYTSQLETFVPHRPGVISMYVCGPTVYSYIHIGNARPVVFFDVVRRYFEYLGYDVKYASNFTDVDDKIIDKAKTINQSEIDVANFYIDAFLKDVQSLGSKTDYLQPRVTQYMNEIVDYIASLIDAGYAYEVEGDVYFRVEKIAQYGRLSGRKVEDLIAGSRVDINPLKESPLDFTLWKKTTEGIAWNSPFSTGRPGWHTECVAMIDHLFGEEIDIHGGGADLLFPHHENEIAQSIAKHDHSVSRYWMHNGRLNLEGEKMSKSLGNTVLVKDLGSDLRPFRMFLLSSHYRAPINYSQEALNQYAKEWQRIEKVVQGLHRHLDLLDAFSLDQTIVDESLLAIQKEFNEAMDQDFNTPNALTAINMLVKYTNQMLRESRSEYLLNQTLSLFEILLNVLGLTPHLQRLTKEERELFFQWNEARRTKDYAKADEVRTLLVEKGLL